MNKFYLKELSILGVFVAISFIGVSFIGEPSAKAASHDAGLEAAMTACRATVEKDANGQPDPTAFDSCMTAAGFTKPEGGPGGGQGGPAGLQDALQACSASVAEDSSGRPDRAAIDTCMTAKGFTKPQGPPPTFGQNNANANTAGSTTSDDNATREVSSSGISGQ